MTHDTLILPGSLAYALATQSLPPPPGWKQEADRKGGEVAMIAPLGHGGLLEVVPLSRAWEYAYDGELDARQAEIDDEPEVDLWLPGDPLE